MIPLRYTYIHTYMNEQPSSPNGNHVENNNVISFEKAKRESFFATTKEHVSEYVTKLDPSLYITMTDGGPVHTPLMRVSDTMRVELFQNGTSVGFGVTIDEPMERGQDFVVDAICGGIARWRERNQPEKIAA